jgi:hypothetical protein
MAPYRKHDIDGSLYDSKTGEKHRSHIDCVQSPIGDDVYGRKVRVARFVRLAQNVVIRPVPYRVDYFPTNHAVVPAW